VRRGTAGPAGVVDGYTLMFASLLLFAGIMSDKIGLEADLRLWDRLFQTSPFNRIPFAPSTRCADCREFLQGWAGAAIMLPASMALIREAFPVHGSWQQPSLLGLSAER